MTRPTESNHQDWYADVLWVLLKRAGGNILVPWNEGPDGSYTLRMEHTAEGVRVSIGQPPQPPLEAKTDGRE